jgi:hypothetical protein
MIIRVLGLFLFFPTLATLAAMPLAQRFLPVKQLSADLQTVFAPLVSATVRIDSLNGRCTATRIHARGDLLTARHCVVGCLIREKVYRSKMDPESVEYYELDRQRLGEAECQIQVEGKEETWIVKHAAPYLIDRFSEQGMKLLNRRLFNELRGKGAMANGDFVILAPKAPAPEKPYVCWPKNSELVSAPTNRHASLFSIGYPSETQRDSFNSNGEDLYFTSGQFLNSFADGQCFQEAQEKNRPSLLDQFDEPGTFVSTLDAIYGSSGSAVYSREFGPEQGLPGGGPELVGILTNMYAPREKDGGKQPEVHFCAGAAKALKLQRVQEIMGEAAREYHCVEAGPGSAANSR